MSKVTGVTGNSISDKFCAAQKTAFGDRNEYATKGGLATMGAAFKKGMVLVMSIWDDHSVGMLWLDAPYPPTKDASAPGVSRGTCSPDSGKPTDVETNAASSSVTFSNIKWGAINSTFSAGSGTGTGTGTGGGTTTTTPPTGGGGSTGGGGTVSKWGQCGGMGFTGPTSCSGSTCTVINPWYSQCL